MQENSLWAGFRYIRKVGDDCWDLTDYAVYLDRLKADTPHQLPSVFNIDRNNFDSDNRVHDALISSLEIKTNDENPNSTAILEMVLPANGRVSRIILKDLESYKIRIEIIPVVVRFEEVSYDPSGNVIYNLALLGDDGLISITCKEIMELVGI